MALARRLAGVAREILTAERHGAFVLKADGSPVTSLDRAVEQALRTEIARAAPDHGIIGEEYGPENAERDWVWVIDPIDGTRQFAAGLPNFGTLIALCHRQKPVIGVIAHPWIPMTCIGIAGQGTTINGRPVRCGAWSLPGEAIACLSDPDAFDETTQGGFEAVRGASLWNVYDGGCLGFAALAEGRIGIALNGPNLEPFDIAALIPVVEGAGGVISDWAGNGLDATSHGAIVASASPALHAKVLTLLG
ncbi:MAG: inositol monophosphatase family protein [Pseudomonadota bacterium]